MYREKTVSKYGNRKTELDGMMFDSRKEAQRWAELQWMERGRLISGIERQVVFEIIPKTDKYRAVKYVADFVYIDAKTGEKVVEDCKGMRTDVYLLKKKLMYWKFGIDIKET
jgi:hypothetical protein